MTAVVTVQNKPDSVTDIKVIQSTSPEDELILKPGKTEEFHVSAGNSFSIEEVMAADEGKAADSPPDSPEHPENQSGENQENPAPKDEKEPDEPAKE